VRQSGMRNLLIVGLCGIVLGVAAPAMASSPSQGAYGGSGNSQLSQVQSQNTTTSPTATTAGSTLPFTGLNLGMLGGVAIVMMGAGLALRIRTRSDS
jgi:hypothetical protein